MRKKLIYYTFTPLEHITSNMGDGSDSGNGRALERARRNSHSSRSSSTGKAL